MAVPDFQSMMRPLLSLASDGSDHSVSEAYRYLAGHFGLSPDDLRELLPSGKQTRFENRVQWAKTHLVKAGALTMAGRGLFRISDRGRILLSKCPDRVGMAALREFEEFREFRSAHRRPSPEPEAEVLEASQTPREVLESAYQQLRATLAREILERLQAATPSFFERVVVDLLVAMGYGGSRRDAGQVMRAGADGGVDGVIKEDRLGLDAVYVQAKRWSDAVGRPAVQGFAGSLMGLKARKGVFMTTSTFSRDARQYVETVQERNIVLIDGEQLAQLMIDHDVGVSEDYSFVVKQVDSDYFGGNL